MDNGDSTPGGGTPTQGETTTTQSSPQADNPFAQTDTSVQTPPADQSTQQQTQQVAPTTQAATPPVAPVPPTTPSIQPPADLTKTVTEAVLAAERARQQAAQQTQQQTIQDLTPEQFNKKYGVVQVTPQHMQQIFDQDPAKGAAALNSIIQGAVKQALLMGNAFAEHKLGKVIEQITPLQQAHQEQHERSLWDGFFKGNPDLVNERALIEEIKDAAIGRKMTFDSKDALYTFLAKTARERLARVGGSQAQGTTANVAPNVQQRQAPPTRQMTPLSQGGRSGTGKASSKSDAELIFS